MQRDNLQRVIKLNRKKIIKFDTLAFEYVVVFAAG